MRPIWFILFLGVALPSQAQKGFEFTASTSANFSFLHNQNDLAESSILLQPSFGTHTQLTLGHNLNSMIGVGTGLGFSYLQQNYLKTATAKQLTVLREKNRRELTYIRLPVFIKINTDPYAPIGLFMRIGPHLDALLTSTSTTQFPFNLGLADETINYRNKYKKKDEPLDIFKNVVVGLSLDVGMRIRLNDQFGLLLLAHIESSLSDLEGQDAIRYFPSELKNRGSKEFILSRDQSWGIMMGLNIGLIYTPIRQGNNRQRKRKYRTHYWS